MSITILFRSKELFPNENNLLSTQAGHSWNKEGLWWTPKGLPESSVSLKILHFGSKQRLSWTPEHFQDSSISLQVVDSRRNFGLNVSYCLLPESSISQEIPDSGSTLWRPNKYSCCTNPVCKIESFESKTLVRIKLCFPINSFHRPPEVGTTEA